MLAEDRIFLSTEASTALRTQVGEVLRLQSGTRILDFTVAGQLPGVTDGRRMAVMDIAACSGTSPCSAA